MAIAAVPKYLGSDFSGASPGMRFGYYLQLWGQDRRHKTLLWDTHDIAYEIRGRDRQERAVKYENKVDAIKVATHLTNRDHELITAIEQRKEMLIQSCRPDDLIVIDSTSIAPFTTGLGNEHPLENGFAFLNPYGIPYLPGSGIKGVVREAVRELASGDWGESGWNNELSYHLSGAGSLKLSMVDLLLGREGEDGDSDHFRGVLSFWDVIPVIKGKHLTVEIMTPHFSHYYQQNPVMGSTSPHDSGQPNPISFLTVPPGAGFTFVVVCDTERLRRLAGDLVEEWQELVESAMTHAFEWLGFGAKGSVGYGAMSQGRRREPPPPPVAPLSPIEEKIRQITASGTDNPAVALLQALEAGKFDESEEPPTARWVWALWKDEGKWNPEFSGSNKQKVKQRDRCLKVRRWADRDGSALEPEPEWITGVVEKVKSWRK